MNEQILEKGLFIHEGPKPKDEENNKIVSESLKKEPTDNGRTENTDSPTLHTG